MQTITEKYAELNKELHASRPDYGCKSSRHGKTVCSISHQYDAESILDYGCGKGDLVKFLRANTNCRVVGYDPGHPKFCEVQAKPCDILTCTDVLEHIEPDCLSSVLDDMYANCNKAMYIHVATRLDSSKLLPDGTNPHKIVEPIEWWMEKFKDHFKDPSITILLDVVGKAFSCLVSVRK